MKKFKSLGVQSVIYCEGSCNIDYIDEVNEFWSRLIMCREGYELMMCRYSIDAHEELILVDIQTPIHNVIWN